MPPRMAASTVATDYSTEMVMSECRSFAAIAAAGLLPSAWADGSRAVAPDASAIERFGTATASANYRHSCWSCLPRHSRCEVSPMAKTVGDFFIERLHQWGVRRIYGYPGDGINGVFGALQRAKGKIEFIQCRHEEMAAFMASAHAKFTGELGVCIATSGPGAAHLITGLYDARLDHMPVLAIVGQQARTALGGHYQQEL